MTLHRFCNEDLNIIKTETLWHGYFKMLKFTFSHRLFKGGQSAIIERELFDRGNAVAVILYDAITDEVVLIEQIRVGAFSGTGNPWLIELVAGMIEENEESVDVANRETLEETGLSIKHCEKVMSYWSSPGGMSERIDLFVANVNAAEAADVAGLSEEGEDIRILTLPAQQAFSALANGEIVNATTIIGLQWLQLNHQRLRQQWLSQL